SPISASPDSLRRTRRYWSCDMDSALVLEEVGGIVTVPGPREPALPSRPAPVPPGGRGGRRGAWPMPRGPCPWHPRNRTWLAFLQLSVDTNLPVREHWPHNGERAPPVPGRLFLGFSSRSTTWSATDEQEQQQCPAGEDSTERALARPGPVRFGHGACAVQHLRQHHRPGGGRRHHPGREPGNRLHP